MPLFHMMPFTLLYD